MEMEQHAALAALTTFGVGGTARWLAHARSEAEVGEALDFARDRQLHLFVLGGGSNLLVDDAEFPGLVLRVEIAGVERDHQGDVSVYRVGAGTDWETLVAQTIAANDQGMECLSGIPGSTGGVPVQNVGAYGQEASQIVSSVRAIEVATGDVVTFNNDECEFAYRRSRFNTRDVGRYVLTQVEFTLRHGGEPALKYADLQKYFSSRDVARPSLVEVREAVLAIRQSKGMVVRPPHSDDHSAGSFFKNPIVANAKTQSIAENFGGNIPQWPAAAGQTKLSAAWLIEHAGFHKGYELGPVRVSTRHTLALVNTGDATCADVLALRDRIAAAVNERFGIALEMEPVRLTPQSGVVLSRR